MEMVVNKKKEELRRELRKRLLSLTEGELKRRSKKVGGFLSTLPIYKEAKLIGVYYPLKGEVDILEITGRVFDSGRFCFPLMDLEKGSLRYFQIKSLEKDFTLGPLGVMQPSPERTKEVDIAQIDMVIVPGLAFDFQRNRLGRGAGFYDHFLKKIKFPAKKVGVAFDFQILESLPVCSPFDEKVDIVISEDIII